MVTSTIEKNIPYYYTFMFFREFMLILPIFVLFYQENGLNFQQIGYLSLTVSIIGLLLEMPTGIFADKYGRKLSLMIGASCYILGYLLRAIGTTFPNFIVAMGTLSIGKAFISGADSALLYDSLKELKKEHLYKEIAGRATFIMLTGTALASILGGFFVHIGLRKLHFLSVIPMILLFIISSLFHEPQRRRKITFSGIGAHFKESIAFSFTHKSVRFVILFSGLMTGMMLISHIFFQPYMLKVGISTTQFGIWYSLFLFASAISSKWAHIIEKKIGENYSLLIIPLVISVQFLFMAKISASWGLAFIFFGEFAWGFSIPLISHYINRHVESHHRATILSLNAMCHQLVWALCSPLIGYLADIWTFQEALLVQAGIIAISTVILFITKR